MTLEEGPKMGPCRDFDTFVLQMNVAQVKPYTTSAKSYFQHMGYFKQFVFALVVKLYVRIKSIKAEVINYCYKNNNSHMKFTIYLI